MIAVKRIGVVGAGTMGSGIAQVAAMAGFPVQLYDLDQPALEKGLMTVRRSLDRFVRRGQLTQDDAAAAIERIVPSTDLTALRDVDVLIEAAPEDLALKRDLFARLDRTCSAEAVLATNTSSLSVTELAAATCHPERVLAMHFFNPPPMLPLVEVARAEQTGRAAIDTALQLARRLGKTPVEVADTPGFIVNRVARPFYLEALRIVGEGLADPVTVDRVLRLGGFRMGPFELMDLIGLDVNFAVTESVWQRTFHDPRYRPHPIQLQMIRAGRLGRKTGRGFYDYVDTHESPTVEGDAPVSRHIGSVTVVGEGELADGLRQLAAAAGLSQVEDLGHADVAVVANPGFLEVRRLGVRNVADRIRDGATILAHSSPWSVTEVAAFQRRTDRVVGFSVVGDPLSATLVEVAPGLNAADDAVEMGLAFFAALGKEPVRVGDGPGMVLLRVVSMLVNEAAAALDDAVADADAIDTAMKLGVAYPFGPLEWGDRLGLDLVLWTIRALQQDYGEDAYRPAVRLRRLVQANRLGHKTGRGFLGV